MRVAVIGGTGVLGGAVVHELAARGHQVIVVSRTAPRVLLPGTEHRAADLTTGSGVAAALASCDTVVDAANSVTKSKSLLVDGVRRLLEAEQQAGVGHHVEISIVGCDLVPYAYYRTKVAQEHVVTTGPVPWTLLRATQFHELITQFVSLPSRLRIAPHSTLKFQPVDVGAVAVRLADAVGQGPSGRMPDLGGPTVHTFTELAQIYRAHQHRSALPMPIPTPGRAGRAVRGGALCLDDTGEARGRGYAAWLADRTDPTAG
ncbi:NAD(P)H-binding protein [Nocardia sp. NPDC050710]|uniref:SDR family oxidoreductase n=1 Tax=Nocardia sp. NPDC050710 TaxID=3157220 RepID=UPI0033DB53B9